MVPASEVEINFVRSSGPGGQNVNKTSSKAQLRWHVDRSSAFTPAEKQRIHDFLDNRINAAGEIILSSEQERSQSQNKAIVLQQLEDLVAQALVPMIPRVPTKPTRASKKRRLKQKVHRTETKQRRKGDEAKTFLD